MRPPQTGVPGRDMTSRNADGPTIPLPRPTTVPEAADFPTVPRLSAAEADPACRPADEPTVAGGTWAASDAAAPAMAAPPVAAPPSTHAAARSAARAAAATAAGAASDATGQAGFRPDIEGLRALAILLVVGFHSGIPGMTGGYVGVDVFFVVSGFVITRSIMRDPAAAARETLGAFYARRARRVLPQAALVLVSTTIAGFILLNPLHRLDLMRDVAAAAVYLANFGFIATETNYDLAGGATSPVLHYWSLAVEEQFYLVWPLLFLVARRVARALRVQPAVVARPLFLGVGAVSLLVGIAWTQTRETVAYFHPFCRAWEFCLGALLATAAARPPATSWRWLRTSWRAVVGWAGAGATVAAAVSFDEATLFPGTAALVPTLGTAALIWAGSRGSSGAGGAPGPGRKASALVPATVLSSGPVRFVGRLSFAWYLWHWPALVLTEAAIGNLDWHAKAAVVLGSAVPAYLSLRLFEEPVRQSPVVMSRHRRGIAVGLSAVVIPLVVALVVASWTAQRISGTDVVTASDVGQVSPEAPFGTSTSNSGPVTPGPLVARDDYPGYPSECIVTVLVVTSPPCLVDAVGTTGHVLLLGDSHAGQWFGAVSGVAARQGWSVQVLNKSGCPLPKIEIVNPDLGREYTECDVWRENILDQVLHGPRPELIFVTSLNRYATDPAYLLEGWRYVLDWLAPMQVPIVYLQDSPYPERDIPACISASFDDWAKCSFDRSVAFRPEPLSAALTSGQFPGTYPVDFTSILCPGTDKCPAVIGGVLLYRDHSHLTDTAATLLTPSLDKQLVDLGLLPDR